MPRLLPRPKAIAGTPGGRRRRVRRVAAIAAVWASVLVVGLFGVELYARSSQRYLLWSFPLRSRQPYFTEPDRLKVYNRRFYEERREVFQDWPIPLELFDADKPQPKYLFKPNLRMVLRWGGTLSPARPWEGVHWSSNSWGFRGPEFSVKKPAGTVRIVCLGASTTEGSQRDNETYPHFLQQALDRLFPTRKIEVINAGHQAQDVVDLLEILRQRVLPLKPDIVLFYEVANNIGWGEFVPTPLPCQIGGCAPMTYSRLHGFLRAHSALFTFLAPRLGVAIDIPPPWPHQFDDTSPKQNAERYRAALRSIVRETRESGSRIVLSSYVTLAHDGLKVSFDDNVPVFEDLHRRYYPLTPGEIGRIYDYYNRVVRDVAREFEVPFVDAAREFPRDLKYFPFDIIHFSPEGNRVLAGIFARHLSDMVLRQAAPGAVRQR